MRQSRKGAYHEQTNPAKPLARMQNRFEAHSRFTIAFLFVASLSLVVIALELSLRAINAYDPFDLNYYTRPSVEGSGVRITPYGLIRVNELGYPDIEFDLTDSRTRVGYVGDSIAHGLGVGHGYRITDYMRESLGEYQHLTLAKIGADAPSPREVEELAERLGLDKLVYLMNLNDIQPMNRNDAQPESLKSFSLIQRIKQHSIFSFIDQLRLHSHAYNMLRLAARNTLLQIGSDPEGTPAYEFEPKRYLEIVSQTAANINELGTTLARHGVEFCIVILPYEMQISAEAERYYTKNGIYWESGFPARSTQEMLKLKIDSGTQVVDAYNAFIRPGLQEEDRESIKPGQFYINRAGGALDWNHPNRLGHKTVADFLLKVRPCSL